MGRTKEFEPDVALQAALELFWTRGYEATSIADLVEHLGIGRASIYATFGGKHELFAKALKRYCAQVDPQILDDLSQPGPALPGVKAVVTRFATEAMQDLNRRGCLVTNTAVELAPHDDELAKQVQTSWAYLETLLTATLTRARAQGELAPSAEPRALARTLLVFMQGIRVVGKAAATPEVIDDATKHVLTLLA